MGQDDVGRERGQFRGVPANSAALAVAQRVSIRTLRPMVQPNCASPCRNPPSQGLKLRIVRGCGQEDADAPHSAACCARAASGQAPHAPREA